MLTESEIGWLRRRSMASSLYYCGWCMKYALCCNQQFNRCPIKNSDWQEAAIFETRVAAKLANGFPNRSCRDWEKDYKCPGWEVCKYLGVSKFHCPFAALKGARLQVDEEMDEQVQD